LLQALWAIRCNRCRAATKNAPWFNNAGFTALGNGEKQCAKGLDTFGITG